MKILFITSGYKGIYDWFEGWILHELKKKYEVKFFNFNNGLPALKMVTQTFKPELALTLVGFKLPNPMIQWLKQQKIKTAVWFTEDPYYMDRTAILANQYDYIFSIDSAAVEYYQKKGHPHAFQLSLATSTEVFKPKEVDKKFSSDICFVGFPYPERVREIQRLLQNTPYKILVVGKWKGPLYKFRNHRNLLIHEGWVDPQGVADFYNGAKIVLNTHRPYNLQQNMNRVGIVGKSINNRTFDVAACSSFQLIECKDDLKDHFMENEEIVTFTNALELMEKIDFYIKNDEERNHIASKARDRVLKEHTFESRVNKLMSLIINPSHTDDS
jgi:spore maturation protein CgeB